MIQVIPEGKYNGYDIVITINKHIHNEIRELKEHAEETLENKKFKLTIDSWLTELEHKLLLTVEED